MERFDHWRERVQEDRVVHIKGFGDSPKSEEACAVYDEDSEEFGSGYMVRNGERATLKPGRIEDLARTLQLTGGQLRIVV